MGIEWLEFLVEPEGGCGECVVHAPLLWEMYHLRIF